MIVKLIIFLGIFIIVNRNVLKKRYLYICNWIKVKYVFVKYCKIFCFFIVIIVVVVDVICGC